MTEKTFNKKINAWIKIFGILFILVSLTRIPLVIFLPKWFNRLGIDVITLEVIIGYFLIIRAYWARIFGLMVSAGAVFVYWVYAASHYVNRTPQIICYIYTFFYGCFFLFLLLPPVKQAFGFPPYLRKIGSLSDEEIKKITYGVRFVAVFLVLYGLLMVILSDWFSRHGFSAGDATTYFFILIFQTTIAIGLLLKRKILGRVFGVVLSFFYTSAYIAIPFLERSAIQGLVGGVMTVFTVLSFACIFFPGSSSYEGVFSFRFFNYFLARGIPH